MIRYIIGISLISIVIMIIRRLSEGKILKRHQYAMWLLIPVYMIVSPFLKINIPVAEELSFLIPASAETVFVSEDYGADLTAVEGAGTNEVEGLVFEHSHIEHNADEIGTSGGNKAGRSDKKPVNTSLVLNCIYCSVTVSLILLLVVYNAGFVAFCRRYRKYVGTDSKSGLKIYGISHKGVPFLLFNKIYIENDSKGVSEYAVCHEACHFKHGDFIWVIVSYIVLALNWYNPVIWAAFILSGRDCELACDEEVIAVCGADSFAKYAETLLSMMQQRSKTTAALSVSTGMKSSYKNMKSRIISIAHPARTSYKVLAMSLASLIVISGFSVLEPMAEESSSISELIISDAGVELPLKREIPFDYDTGIPEVVNSLSNEHEICFYRDGNPVKGKMILPEGNGPFKTVVMLGEFGSKISDYDVIYTMLSKNGYAVVLLENGYEQLIIERQVKGPSPVGDLYFEQVLDLYAVLDELRYFPVIDLENVYLCGIDNGGLIAAYTGVERQSDIKGMILIGPYLSAGEYITFSSEPKLVARIYEMFKECYIPVLILEPHNGQLASASRAVGSLPDGRLVELENYWNYYEISNEIIVELEDL